MKSQRPNVIEGKDRQQIMDVTWAVKGDIFRTREMGVGLRGVMKYRRRVRVLKERSLRRYIGDKKV